MNGCISLKSILVASVVAVGLFGIGSGSANAGHDLYGGFGGGYGLTSNYGSSCHDDLYVPRCSYRTVIDYEYRTETFYDYITKYDHCGKPYTVKVLRTRTIQVPVQRLVKVCY
jgi:hypothetical protein